MRSEAGAVSVPAGAPAARLGVRGFAARLAAPLIVALGGGALGIGAVLVARGGVESRPVLAAAVLAAGAAAGVAPLRYGLAAAAVLATFNGFLLDFAGSNALYWNEILVGLLLLRSFLRRRPSRAELAAAAAVAVVYLAYLVGGAGAGEVFWGAKVLLTAVLAGWALVRLRPARDVWRATYYGLTAGVAANLVVAVWQRSQGASRLVALGLSPVDRIRDQRGVVRAFGGFTSPAPFAYFLAISLLCWLAFALGRDEDRRLALLTIWMPAAAVLGIAWSLDRTALLALAVAVIATGARALRPARVLALAGLTAAVVGGVLFIAGASAREHFRAGVTLDSGAARVRISIWRQYSDSLSLFGAGPAASGSAYQHVALRSDMPRRYWLGGSWRLGSTRTGVQRYLAHAPARVSVDVGAHRPAVKLRGDLRALGRTRTVVISDRSSGRVLARARVGPAKFVHVTARLRAGRGEDSFLITTLPGARPGVDEAEFRNLRVTGLPPARNPTEAMVEQRFGRLNAGVVDNQYVSWLFSYGLLGGGAICLPWLAFTLAPVVRRRPGGSVGLAAAFVGVFVAVAAVAVNVWEEAPTDLLAALVLGQALAARRRKGTGATSA